MNYPEAIQFLYDLQLFGAKFGLENTRRLASLAGNPQDQLKFIHVAGSNGKGSVCAMLESIYREAGYQTGLYSSPHLIHFGERIRTDNQPASEATIIALTAQAKQLLAEGTERGWWPRLGTADAENVGHPTFFEVVTVMAMIHFANQNCDVVLWETGMGGRLDATNIVTPLASVITNISLEHSAYLGDTIEKIAAEKSGIIKPWIPVITGSTDEMALRVISEVAKSRNAPLTKCLSNQCGVSTNVFPKSYQQLNADLACSVVRVLIGTLGVSDENIERGLKSFSLPGRLQRIARANQTILVDGAHNPASMAALCESLTEELRPVLFGCFDDKDLQQVIKILAPSASEFHLVPINSPRSANLNNAAELIHKLNDEIPTYIYDNLEAALENTAKNSEILITGSLYLAGEALSLLSDKDEEPSETSLNDWRASTR